MRTQMSAVSPFQHPLTRNQSGNKVWSHILQDISGTAVITLPSVQDFFFFSFNETYTTGSMFSRYVMPTELVNIC